MTTKFASPLAEASGKLSAAYKAATTARIVLNQTQANHDKTAASVEKWTEDWPNLAEREGRPTFQDPTNGLAVTVDGLPYMIEGRQANRPDIYTGPPPSDKTLSTLAGLVTKAETKVTKALKAEQKAREEWEPPTKTGWVVLKPKRIAGIGYAAGDAFDPTTVEPRRLEQFKRVGLIGHG